MTTPPTGWMRWKICALLFFATTINYMDRQILGILAPDLQRSIGWSEVDYGNIIVAFQVAYAIGLLGAGAFMDRFGTRLGYARRGHWSVARRRARWPDRSIHRRACARLVKGNFRDQDNREWFPKRERALATGIFNGGSNIGAIIAPLAVPFLAINYGWQWAFAIVGATGLLWLFAWLKMYRRPEEHPHLSAAERAHIQSDPPEGTERIRGRTSSATVKRGRSASGNSSPIRSGGSTSTGSASFSTKTTASNSRKSACRSPVPCL